MLKLDVADERPEISPPQKVECGESHPRDLDRWTTLNPGCFPGIISIQMLEYLTYITGVQGYRVEILE